MRPSALPATEGAGPGPTGLTQLGLGHLWGLVPGGKPRCHPPGCHVQVTWGPVHVTEDAGSPGELAPGPARAAAEQVGTGPPAVPAQDGVPARAREAMLLAGGWAGLTGGPALCAPALPTHPGLHGLAELGRWDAEGSQIARGGRRGRSAGLSGALALLMVVGVGGVQWCPSPAEAQLGHARRRVRGQPVPCCPPFSAPCYHFEETEPVAFLFRKCCLPCLGLLYKKETQLNMASPDQKRAVGTGAQQTECVPGRRGTRRPLACSSGWPGCPWSPPSQKMEERWADLQMLPGSQAPWGGHQAGAVLARRLIRLQEGEGSDPRISQATE